MKLAFTALFACWTIYSSSTAVLSLPPSLIASAASLQQNHDHHHDKEKRADVSGHFRKDVDGASSSSPERAANNEGGGSIAPDSITIQRSAAAVANLGETSPEHRHQRVSRMAEGVSSTQQHFGQQRNADESVYDLNKFLQAMKIPDETSDNIDNIEIADDDDDTTSQSTKAMHFLLPSTPARLQVPHQPQAQAQADANEFFTPLKHWARHCQPDSNCPPQFYRALFANRNGNNRGASVMDRNRLSGGGGGYNAKHIGGVDEIASMALNDKFDVGGSAEGDDMSSNYGERQKNHNDVFMFLNGEQDLITFLRWAMRLLYQDKNVANYTDNSAEYYHPGMYIWKKLNLSGRIEPPLFVEEPHYIIVRREQLNDDIKMNPKYNKNDPFIPPRGRKHNMPDLDALLHRYETFVPNRGKRDKIKDMLKSNDLFFPNRGKKKRDFEYENGRLRSSGGNTKATSTAKAASVISTNYAGGGRDESKSSNVAPADDDDADNDWNRAMPVAILMRDVLEKLMQEEARRNEKHFRRQLKSGGGDKITTNANAINHLDYYDDLDRSSDGPPQWLGSMLNYKFNGFHPSVEVERSMPVAVAIDGETNEMSTPQKLAAALEAASKDHALQQLLRAQQAVQQIHAINGYGEVGGEGEGDIDGDVDDDVQVGIGVDRGGIRIASPRSMSTAMAHQQLKQKERIQRLLQQRHLMTMPQYVYPSGEDQKQQYRQKNQNNLRQVKSFTDPDSLLHRHLQLMQQDQQQRNNIQHFQQKLHRLQRQRDPWPLETPSSRSDAFDSPYN